MRLESDTCQWTIMFSLTSREDEGNILSLTKLPTEVCHEMFCSADGIL